MEVFQSIQIDRDARREIAIFLVTNNLQQHRKKHQGMREIDVKWSSINYKDRLVAAGNPGLVRKFPRCLGIDAVGLTSDSKVPVSVIGFPLGVGVESLQGGWSQKIWVDDSWIIELPRELSMRTAAFWGTSGLTAAYIFQLVQKQFGWSPKKSVEVCVTGAGCAVGRMVSAILHHLGYSVTRVMTSPNNLSDLACGEIISEPDLANMLLKRPPRPRWDVCIDCAGGTLFSKLLSCLRTSGTLFSVGNFRGNDGGAINLDAFYMRSVNVVGVSLENLDRQEKKNLWSIVSEFQGLFSEDAQETLTLDQIPHNLGRRSYPSNVWRTIIDLSRTFSTA